MARHSAPPRHAAGPAIVRSPNLNLRVKVPSKVQFSGGARLIFLLLYHPQGPRTCAGLREVGWQPEGMWPLSPGLSDDPTLAAGPTRTRIPIGPLAQAAQNGSLEERRRRLLLGPRWFSASVCNIRQNTPGVVSSDAVGIKLCTPNDRRSGFFSKTFHWWFVCCVPPLINPKPVV